MKTPLLIKPYPRNVVCYRRWSLRQHNSCRRWRVQDHCTFCFECRHHKLESTRQTETIRRPVCLFLSHRLQRMVRESSPDLLTQATYSIQSHHNKLPSSSTQASRTCTGLCIAQFEVCAYTILAAICRRRVAATSALTPATTSFRACNKRGPAAVHFTFLSQAVYNAAYACSVSECSCCECCDEALRAERRREIVRLCDKNCMSQPNSRFAAKFNSSDASPRARRLEEDKSTAVAPGTIDGNGRRELAACDAVWRHHCIAAGQGRRYSARLARAAQQPKH